MDPNPTPFVGKAVCFTGNFEPGGWTFCNDSVLQIRGNKTSCMILGSNACGGEGIITFALPDLRDRAVPKQKKSGLSGPGYIISAKGDFRPRPNN